MRVETKVRMRGQASARAEDEGTGPNTGVGKTRVIQKQSTSYLRDHRTRREPGACLIGKLQTKTMAHRIALYERPWRDRAHANALYETMAYCNTPVRVHV